MTNLYGDTFENGDQGNRTRVGGRKVEFAKDSSDKLTPGCAGSGSRGERSWANSLDS